MSQIVANKNKMLLQTFIQQMYKITVLYFERNQLSINASKTEIFLVPYGNENDDNMFIMTKDGEIVKYQNQVKILGVGFHFKNNKEAHISAIASQVGMAYQKLKPFIQHAPPEQGKTIILSKIESIALYTAPLIFNEKESLKKD